MADARLFEFATEDDRAIVTEDVRGFAVLAAQRLTDGDSHCGLIFTAPQRFSRASTAYPGDVIAALRNFLAAPPAESDTWIRWL